MYLKQNILKSSQFEVVFFHEDGVQSPPISSGYGVRLLQSDPNKKSGRRGSAPQVTFVATWWAKKSVEHRPSNGL